jgi:hypothetical protein
MKVALPFKISRMRAIEASIIATQVNLDSQTQQYKKIKEEIKQEALKGFFEMTYCGKINSEVKKKLMKEGYAIGTPIYEKADTYTLIEWPKS